MKFGVNDLMNLSCFCDVYRRRNSDAKAENEHETLAETVVNDAKNNEMEAVVQEKGSN